MQRLGYDRYGAHGGDFGSLISVHLGQLHPDRVIGVHVVGSLASPSGDPAELATLTDGERQHMEDRKRFWSQERGYADIQSTRPQTLAYGLTDSPAGQLAWIVEKFKGWTDSATVPEDAIDRDLLLTNVTVYWLTGTAESPARLYKETPDLGQHIAREPSTVPPEPRRSPGMPPCRSDDSPRATTILCTGRSSTVAATSRPWKYPTYSSATCRSSSMC